MGDGEFGNPDGGRGRPQGEPHLGGHAARYGDFYSLTSFNAFGYLLVASPADDEARTRPPDSTTLVKGPTDG